MLAAELAASMEAAAMDYVPGKGDGAAGDLGAPFMEAEDEDEEEWQSWLDWGEVDRQAGGSSSST